MRKLFIVAVVMLALATGCGDDGDATSASASPAGATSQTSSPAASEATTAGGDCMDVSEAEGQADLEMQDFVFAPPCLVISNAQGLRLHNEGKNEHNWSVEGISGLDVDVSPGDENNTEATGLLPGQYTFFCKYHRESNDMEGKLFVKAA